MTYACNVPINGSESGKNSFAKTKPVTVLYSKKSYHSIVVPIVLAINARRSCPRCSEADKYGRAVRSVATLRSSLRRLPHLPAFAANFAILRGECPQFGAVSPWRLHYRRIKRVLEPV